MFIKRKKKEEEENDFSWDVEDEEVSHTMWSKQIKKLLKKVGLC